jgi:peptidoglycan/xylan/chitin deacetylase (PgdA/CDA1 family)
MTLQELCMIATAGHEIGCHTRTHSILTQLSGVELKDEINGGREDLVRLGCKILSIAYPNGNSNYEVQRVVAECGMTSGVVTQPGCVRSNDDMFAIPRIDVNMERLFRWSNDPAEGLLAEICWQSLKP